MTTVPAVTTVKLRVGWWARLGGAIPLVFAVLGSISTHSFIFTGFVWYLVGLGLVSVATTGWFGVNLNPSGVVVHNLRRRRLAWTDIRAVTIEPILGGRRVVLWTIEGQRVPLRAPSVDFTGLGRRRFEYGYHTLGQWWLAYHAGPARPVRVAS